jgi:hypothetical protein
MVFAYVGPGAGFVVLGPGFVVLAVILLLVAGFVWYPLELLRRTIARRVGRVRAPRTED